METKNSDVRKGEINVRDLTAKYWGRGEKEVEVCVILVDDQNP